MAAVLKRGVMGCGVRKKTPLLPNNAGERG